MSKTIVLFDIDFTLFDAETYRNKFVKLIGEEIGYKGKDFIKIAEDAYQLSKERVGYFDPTAFIDDLEKFVGGKIKKKELADIISNQELVDGSMYQDVFDVLQTLSVNKEIVLGIFSAGKLSIQRPKIKLIENFLKEENIHIFEFHKGNALPELLKKYSGYKIYLIDDILGILKIANSLNPNIITIWIKRRSDAVYKKVDNFSPKYIIKSLNEVVPIVNKY